jgi:antitoxin component of MazEF toxin-antitoxin module
MPIIRKIIKIGNTSKAVIIPKTWLDYYGEQRGHDIDRVFIEVNDCLKIRPALEDKKVD